LQQVLDVRKAIVQHRRKIMEDEKPSASMKTLLLTYASKNLNGHGSAFHEKVATLDQHFDLINFTLINFEFELAIVDCGGIVSL
jgi:hypothetical protein